MARSYVRDDRRLWDKLRRQLAKQSSKEVVVGVTSGTTENTGASVAQYAAMNEYGTSSIPARPFMRTAFDSNRQKLERTADRAVGLVIDGKMSETAALESMGLQMRAFIVRSIKSGPWAPNAESTIRQKKSDKPLQDHGTLLANIQYEIRPLTSERARDLK